MRSAGRTTIPGNPVGVVAPGLALIAVTYGLARFAYGLLVPELREAFGLSPSLLGVVGAGSYVGYRAATSVSLALTTRTGPRSMAVAAAAPSAWVLAAGVLVAGNSTGLASPPLGEAVARAVRVEERDRANTIINSGTSVLSEPAALLATGQRGWPEPVSLLQVCWSCCGTCEPCPTPARRGAPRVRLREIWPRPVAGFTVRSAAHPDNSGRRAGSARQSGVSDGETGGPKGEWRRAARRRGAGITPCSARG